MCLVFEIYAARGMMWVMEHPVNSLVQFHPRFQRPLERHRVWRVATQQGNFGASSVKPTWSLWGGAIYKSYVFGPYAMLSVESTRR